MITTNKARGAVNIDNMVRLTGLSTDVKPTNLCPIDPYTRLPNGSSFTEIDTGDVYLFDDANDIWLLQPKSGGVVPPVPDNKLYLYKDGDECVDITGGWVSILSGGGTMYTKNKDHMLVSMTSPTTSAFVSRIGTARAIQFVEEQFLCVELEFIKSELLSNKYYTYSDIVANPTLVTTYSQNVEASYSNGGLDLDPSNTSVVYRLRILGCTSPTYPQIVANHWSDSRQDIVYKIKKVWLEK